MDKQKKTRIAAAMLALMMIFMSGCSESVAPVASGSAGATNDSVRPSESEKPGEPSSEYGSEKELQFVMKEESLEQKAVGDYYIVAVDFLAVNPSEKDIELKGFASKNILETFYAMNPLGAFENISITSQTVHARTVVGDMPCIVASEGERILEAGKTIGGSIYVRVPMSVTDVTLWHHERKIGMILCGAAIEGKDPCSPVVAVGQTMNLLQVEATVSDIEINENFVNYVMKITNQRTNPVCITSNNFKMTVENAAGEIKKYSVAIDATLFDTNLQKGNSSEGYVQVILSESLKAGDKVILTYAPDLQYNEYSMNWTHTCA